MIDERAASARPLSTPLTTSGRFPLSRCRKQELAMVDLSKFPRGSHVIEWMHVRYDRRVGRMWADVRHLAHGQA